MPSLFSRSRTTSTSKHLPPTPHADSLDEFGRVTSRGSTVRGVQSIVSLSSKKDKHNDRKKDKTRARTLSSAKGKGGQAVDEDEPQIPDGSFFPLNLDPPRRLEQDGQNAQTTRERDQDYGYLSYQRHVILGLEETDRLVRVLSSELGSRGLTTPFIFSTLGLDVSAAGVRRLVQAFLRTCVPFPAPDAEHSWQEETRFAGPHELGMCLRWGLARVVRFVGGNEVRGLVPWETYLEWSEAEVALNYPPTHFATFIQSLIPPLRSIITNILTLLARFTAHSASSGHTPPTLSPLFGPLLFGLGPAALAFHHAYVHYLRATNAMEHLMLAFIRWQDAPSNDSSNSFGQGSAASLGVPSRLKDWIRGYPAMLPTVHVKKEDRLQPRRGARTVRVVCVRRNVRMYTPDLVKTASSWATRDPQHPSAAGSLALSREWERVAPPTLKLPPRYADSYKKRMDLPNNFHPQTAPAPSNNSTGSATSSTSSTLHDDEYLGVNKDEERFRSLTDLKWGEFEAMGFGGQDDSEKKLQFDLTESARTARAAKRATLTWTDFSTTGFSRSDAPLNATLQFSAPVTDTISQWPDAHAEMRRKLKKTQRSLPPFGWDTEPVMGPEEVIEEAFIDVFCDLVYGGGWMDIEREEEVDRECNWALVEYRSLPIAKSTYTGTGDPRTTSIVFLFEEFVPFEYRQQLSAGVQNKRRLAFLFSPGKAKPWKQAATLNGRPYVVGHVPTSPSVREVEFEGMLRGTTSATKVMTFDHNGSVKTATSPKQAQTPPVRTSTATATSTVGSIAGTISGPLYVAPVRNSASPRPPSPSTPTAQNRKSRFRLPTVTSPPRTAGLPPSEYEDVDFETRLAGYSDDDLNNGNAATSKLGRLTSVAVKSERRRSKDDAWVDILVATSSRRMGGQDAELRKPGGARALRGGRSDPELASQEVAEALASARVRPLSDDEGDIEPMSVPHRSQISDSARDSVSEASYQDDRTETGAEDEEEEDNGPQPSRSRLGYFDLHPERRQGLPAHPRDVIDDDPRERFRRTSMDSETDIPYPRERVMSSATSDFEPTDRPDSPEIDIPHFKLNHDSHLTEDGEHSKKDSMTLTDLVTTPKSEEPMRSIGKSSGTPGKTAALIEMYRERERASSKSPAATSPVMRALPRTPLQAKAEAPLPSPPERTPSPPLAPDSEIPEPPSLVFESGRDSPGRYVHGAPLHNVVEEEEEE
ncbi:hypothetical protein OF83DRAFT_1134497 [Amylostereum chailletii]|nr:hypothetical protein OF83DRAFT_1134497 [Amylostereum chailletii]